MATYQNATIRYNPPNRKRDLGMRGDLTLNHWLRDALAEKQVSQSDLARHWSISFNKDVDRSLVNKIIKGKRALSVEESIAASQYLGVPLPMRTQKRQVPLVGFIGAGAEVYQTDVAGPIDYVDAPPDVGPHTVAVEVRGDSMYGLADDGWLVYYGERLAPVPEMMARLCVVGLRDGRALVKWLEPGPTPGTFNLRSTSAPLIVGADVEWAARVEWIKPR